jgi:uncharacterized membrane protein
MTGWQLLKNALPIMGVGMIGIFAVTAVIILTVLFLNYFSNKISK